METKKSPPQRQRRGFALLSDAKRKSIAKLGGIAAHKSGRAHQFDSDEARAAGRKGGQARRKKGGAA